jgi:hypothetical protein
LIIWISLCLVSVYRMKLLPIKPSPPVTKSFKAESPVF